jgi:hypothetical protein
VLALMVAAAPQTFGAEPQWLTDARAREGKLGALREIRSSDGLFSAKLPVPVMGKIEKQEGSYTVEFSVGSDTTASCEIYPDPRDPAALLRAVAQNTFAKVIEKVQGKVELRAIEAVNAGQFGSTPYLAVSWLYRVNDGKEPRLGAMKQYAAAMQGHGIYCGHIDLGYVRTFESVVRALIESLEFRDATPAPKPFYREVYVASLKGLRVGYMLQTLERDADGDVKALERSAMLIPVTSDALTSLDSSHLEWTHSDGTMINAAHIVSVNDALDVDLSLAPKKGVWHVAGEFKSKKIDETVESANPPGTWLKEALQRRALLGANAAAPREAQLDMWLSADPTHFTESRMSVVGPGDKAGETHFRDSMAGVVADVTVDTATGQVLKATLPLGGQSLTLERIDVQGTY